jgi:WD40 repeat protein
MVKDIKRRDTANYQLCTGGSQRLVLWSLNPFTGEMVGERVTAEGRGSMVRSISWLEFSDDYETVYCGTTSGDFALVNVKQLKLGAPIAACRLGILSLLCWPNGLVVGGGDGTVTTFDSNLHDLCQAQLDGAVVAMSFSPDRLEILAGTSKGFVYRLRVENMASLLVCENHAAPVRCVSYAAGTSDRFATISSDCTLRIWDAADYSVLTTVCVRDAGEPSCLVYTLDFLISGWSDGKIRAHESDTGSPLWLIDNAHRGGVTALVLSHNQRYIMTGGGEGDVRVWELRSRELVSHLKARETHAAHSSPSASEALFCVVAGAHEHNHIAYAVRRRRPRAFVQP